MKRVCVSLCLFFSGSFSNALAIDDVFFDAEVHSDFKEFVQVLESNYIQFPLLTESQQTRWNALKKQSAERISTSQVWTRESANKEILSPALQFFQDANLQLAFLDEANVRHQVSYRKPFYPYVASNLESEPSIHSQRCAVPKPSMILDEQAISTSRGSVRLASIVLSPTPLTSIQCQEGVIPLRAMGANVLPQKSNFVAPILVASSFDPSDSKTKSFLKDVSRHATSPRVVLDLRQNGGGDYRVFVGALSKLGFGESIAEPLRFTLTAQQQFRSEGGQFISLGAPTTKKAVLWVSQNCKGACEWAANEAHRRSDLLLVGSNTSGRTSFTTVLKKVLTRSKIEVQIPTGILSYGQTANDIIAPFGILPEIWLDM